MYKREFLFGVGQEKPHALHVEHTSLYGQGEKFGFVIEQNRREQELLKLSELNSGFDTIYWYQNEDLSRIESDEDGCFLDSNRMVAALEQKAGETQPGEHRRIPLSFKLDVPKQGNYKVTLTIRTREPMKNVLIFTGRRRLAFLGEIPAGTFEHTMTVNVCDIVPRGHTQVYEDKTLDITVVADRPRITELSVEEIACPTVYIAGDSTVTDQSAAYPYTPGTSYSGWGQMLTSYTDERVAVSNHAHSGLTTESFRQEGHYRIIEKYAQPGDYVMFQFGHNDQKLDELKAGGGYRANLVRYVEECRERGLYPLLVTPLARNTWKGNDGAYNDLLEEYAGVCLELGQTLKVPVVDLHRCSMEFVTKHGLEASKAYFYPNDYTHSNDYGAYVMAGFVAEEIRCVCGNHEEQAYRFLAECVTGGYGVWQIAEEIVLPVKPKLFEDVVNPEAAGLLLAEVEDLEQPATRAAVLDMVIKTVRFFPTNVYNDMFADVVGHEWYAGTVECAYQNGMIDEHLVEDGHFGPEKPVTLEEFLMFAMNGYRSRKPFPQEVSCAYDEKCHDYAREYVRAACGIGLLPVDGSADLQRGIDRGEAVRLCRMMGV
ncbi:MAG: GDSL-type esterase/lipase family protein [Candidatus Gastranaerophilales bacterium]|nr:GDSL-type esterase/lipase family protein [Candidatus Gastranaerophilales bacterium]